VARVETECNALGILYRSANASKVLEWTTKIRSATDGVLNASDGAIPLGGTVNGVKFSDKSANTRFFIDRIASRAKMRTRVHDARGYAELLTTLRFLQLQRAALGSHFRIRRGQVHQIAVVAYQSAFWVRVPASAMHGGAKCLDFLVSQWLPLPLPLILCEYLHAVKFQALRFLHGKVHTTCDAKMTADKHLVAPFGLLTSE